MNAPSYLALVASGEIDQRVGALKALLSPCRLCPHDCRVDRLAGVVGRCRAPNGAFVAAATAHFGEEPEISGTRGSGALFFGGCNLRCVYCQNSGISQGPAVTTTPVEDPGQIASRMLAMQERGCHNVNWVTPSHVVPFAVEALAVAARRGLRLPVVYNSSGFDAVETLRLLDGVVDVYLPDLRYADAEVAAELSGARRYPEAARAALVEMARQVGTRNVLDDEGTLRRGLVVRILVLPNDLGDVRESLAFLRDAVGTGVRVALMAQYFPTHQAPSHDLLSRAVGEGEYLRAVALAERMGFENALIQEFTARDFYRPDFAASGEPFADARHFRKD